MEQITVNLPGAPYDIWIKNGLFGHAGELINRIVASKRVVMVTDETVDTLYGNRFIEILLGAGFVAEKIVIPPGEASKSLVMLEQLYRGFIHAKLTRSDYVIAFGGGVVGDLAGFAAATYLRGIRYIQVPTTLLAQIDSSVGGKVAINLPQGKNLVGAFHQPTAVLIDPEFLSSLPSQILCDGMAEAFKYGAIADKVLFDRLAACPSREDFLAQSTDVIAACCRIKRDIVEKDEKDTGQRLILNFGHSIGHAIEQIGQYTVYSHGEAIAIGMVKITEASEQCGLSRSGTAASLREALIRQGLPVAMEPWDKTALFAAMGSDKKNTSDGIQLIVLNEIGRAEIIHFSWREVAAFL